MGNKKLKAAKQNLFFTLFMLWIFVFSPAMYGDETKKDKAEQKTSGLLWLPVIFYTPETKWALGMGGLYYFRPSARRIKTRPSNIGAFLIYTQRKQVIIDIAPDLYFKNEEYRLWGNIGFSKYVDKFYGIGNDTLIDNEENYTSRITRLSINLVKRVHPKLNFGIRYYLEFNKIIEVEEDRHLAKREILGSTGGTASGIGLVMNWDTRDNIFCPSSGSYHQLFATFYHKGLGSDYDFTVFNLDLRKYVPLFSSHVLAFQGYLNFISGSPPFQLLSLFGGASTMRGYYLGRYRDKDMIAFQMEYRIALWKRIGLVGFVGYGDVADKVSHFDLEYFKHSIGFGFRYLFSPEEKLNIRLDVGFGKDSLGFYFTVSEAF